MPDFVIAAVIVLVKKIAAKNAKAMINVLLFRLIKISGLAFE